MASYQYVKICTFALYRNEYLRHVRKAVEKGSSPYFSGHGQCSGVHGRAERRPRTSLTDQMESTVHVALVGVRCFGARWTCVEVLAMLLLAM